MCSINVLIMPFIIKLLIMTCNEFQKICLIIIHIFKFMIFKCVVTAWLNSSSVNWVIIGSGNGLSPVRHQAITRTNADLLSVGLLGTHFSEIWIRILIPFHSQKCIWKFCLSKWRPFCPGGDWRKVTRVTCNFVNTCVYYACQTHEIYQVLSYFVDFKAPRELWNPLSKTVLSNCSFIWNKGPVNIWNYHKVAFS